MKCIMLCFLLSINDFVWAQCTSGDGCDQVTSSTNITTNNNGEVICIDATPGGAVSTNINHDDVTFRVCADNVTFNTINARTNTSFVSYGENTEFSDITIDDPGFSFTAFNTGAVVSGITANNTFSFRAKDGGELSLPSMTSKGGEIIADTNGTITMGGLTLNENLTEVGINQGGKMTINSNFDLNDNGLLNNKDSLFVNGNMTYQGSGNNLNNLCGEAVIDVQNTLTYTTGVMTNNGSIYADELNFNGGEDLQMGPGALLDIRRMASLDVDNPFSFTGNAGECATYSLDEFGSWNKPLSNDAEIYYCSTEDPNDLGNATRSCDDCSGFLDYCNPALPVQFQGFYGDAREEYNQLTWHTSMELNNSHFIIERSMDGQQFSAIGEIDGNGTTNGLSTYTFEDDEIIPVAYYRLKQVDFDGKSDYSNVIVVNRHDHDAFVIFPNPAHQGEIKGMVNAPTDFLEITVYDVSGKEVMLQYMDDAEALKGTINIDNNHQPLSSGIYLIKARMSNKQVTKKVTVY